MPYFALPRNLPHAAKIARRIEWRFATSGLPENPQAQRLMTHMELLLERIGKYEAQNDPPDPEADWAVEEAARIGRILVEEIERLGVGEDRLGQLIRNLFECLGLGEEGAEISLRAGEDPNSLMRPT